MSTDWKLTAKHLKLLRRFDYDLWMVLIELDPLKLKETSNLLRVLTRKGYLTSRIGVGAHPYREWALTEKGIEAL